MQLMMASMDSLQQETYRLLGYEKNLAKQTQLKQQFLQKRVKTPIVVQMCVVVVGPDLCDGFGRSKLPLRLHNFYCSRMLWVQECYGF